MRISRPIAASALALFAMAGAGVASGLAEAPETAPLVVEASDLTPSALPSLTFPVGVYTENRISDHVTIPPGATISFRGLPPGLTYDPRTTAIRGVPTTPGVYQPVATAFLGGIPVRTETTTVTVTGGGAAPGPGPVPAPVQVPAPGPAPAPAPGTISIADIQALPLPQPVKDAILGAALAINNGIQATWNAVPPGSLGR